jgi:hypothetical protein
MERLRRLPSTYQRLISSQVGPCQQAGELTAGLNLNIDRADRFMVELCNQRTRLRQAVFSRCPVVANI